MGCGRVGVGVADVDGDTEVDTDVEGLPGQGSIGNVGGEVGCG